VRDVTCLLEYIDTTQALAYGGGRATVSWPPSDPKNKKIYKQYSAVYTKMFNFRRIALFCVEKCLSKYKMTIFSKHFGGHGPFGPPLATTMLWFTLGNFLRTPLDTSHAVGLSMVATGHGL